MRGSPPSPLPAWQSLSSPPTLAFSRSCSAFASLPGAAVGLSTTHGWARRGAARLSDRRPKKGCAAAVGAVRRRSARAVFVWSSGDGLFHNESGGSEEDAEDEADCEDDDDEEDEGGEALAGGGGGVRGEDEARRTGRARSGDGIDGGRGGSGNRGVGGSWDEGGGKADEDGIGAGDVIGWEDSLLSGAGGGLGGSADFDDNEENDGDDGGAGIGKGGGALEGAVPVVLKAAGSDGNVIYNALTALSTGPDDVERLKGEASEDANDAFKRTVLGIIGTLPSEAYEVTITSDRSGLSRLMHSSLCTGYALRNAEVRLALNDAFSDALAVGTSIRSSTSSLSKDSTTASSDLGGCNSTTTDGTSPGTRSAPVRGAVGRAERGEGGKGKTAKRGRPSKKAVEPEEVDGAAAAQGSESRAASDVTSADAKSNGEPDYMSIVPFRGKVDSSSVSGSVSWWDASLEAKQGMSAADYVSKLESENELLRDRLAASERHASRDTNRILEFMKTLSSEKIHALQRDISSLSEDAFRRVLISFLGDINGSKMQTTYSTSRDYLGQIICWCLLAGYTIRNLEKRHEMQSLFVSTESLDSNLPTAPSSSPSSSSPPSSPSAQQQPPPPPHAPET